MTSLVSESTNERFAQSASVKRYERHRSAARLKTKTDPVIKCVELDYLDELTEILSANARHYTQDHLDHAFHRAAQLGKSDACNILLDHGSDINSLEPPSRHEQRFDNSRGAFSTDQRQLDIWLKQHSAIGGTALHLAVENNHLATVKTLVAKGACLNIVDRAGRTALMLACMRRGNVGLVRMLTNEKECGVNMKEKQRDWTALHFAAESGDSENIRLLLEAGACVDAYDTNHNTPLSLACTLPLYEHPQWPERQPLECVELLFNHGAYINTFNSSDESPLFLAVQAGYTDAAQFLMQRSAVLLPETLRLACLEQRDVAMVKALLDEGNSFQDEYLCALLLVLISSMVSKWSFNARHQEENTHAIARILVKNVSDPKAFSAVSSGMSQPEMGKEFGDEFLNALDKTEHTHLQSYGMLGYALLKGKFSIAYMLYLAGCRDKLHRMQGNAKALQLAKTNPYLMEWLADALDKAPGPDEEESEVFCSGCSLDKVAPYDAVIHEGTHSLMDTVYARREDSKALVSQTLLVYE